MIAGDRKALKATLTQGISNILRQLVDLYSSNLNHLGIQTSVIAGLAFAAAIASSFPDENTGHTFNVFSGLYYTTVQLALISSLLSMVICTISGAYGPSLALTGKSSKVIVYAVREMQGMQEYVFCLGGFSIFCLLTGLSIYGFATYKLGHAILVACLCVVGAVLLFRRGLSTLQDIRYKGSRYLDEIFRAFQGVDGDVVDVSTGPKGAKAALYPAATCAGYLWRRKEIHKGGTFHMQYCVLTKGGLDMYKTKEAYGNGDDRLSRLPLRYMRLSVEAKDFAPESSQVSLSLMGERYKRDRKLMFALLPLDDHEVVNSANTLELQATSVESYREWVSALRSVEEFYQSINGNALTAVLENT
mmetsp:Transcript_24362/g.35745  ORF Transcript_24362/g.35745 Transcript_24362/m.35745 type:complete len:360 (+) Transcript_24362:176-1255(+)|eukprot:CAMPEP_0185023274 /NCGR_PEP_ID=MMETSP1103-20130426/5959_1 /TAXON_ID=36769 /ORGANISM="Paraphysomonas bandaiensis, Strain Caron Lab Isolate" /LENGTH=359 /DNA_ID=CAMNT_0027555785 /DNA_START=178 /DNA_END=1257 /DNA_ORIENTATION=+